MSRVISINNFRLERVRHGKFPDTFQDFDSFLNYLENAGRGYVPIEHLLMAYEMNTGVPFSEEDLKEIVPPAVPLSLYFYFNLPNTVRELKEKFERRKNVNIKP